MHKNIKKIEQDIIMRFLATALGIVSFAASSSVLAIPMDTTGGTDTLVHQATLKNSGKKTEAKFVAEYLDLDPSAISFTKFSGSGGENGTWETVDENSSLQAFNFGSYHPAFFLIKTGDGVGIDGLDDTFSHFLYENVGSLGYGVIDLGLFTRTNGNVEIDMISHVGASGTVTVPEPATLSLLGLGLIAVGFASRKKRLQASDAT